MKQTDYPCHWPNPWMQDSVSMHKNPTPTFVHESGKVGGRGEEERQERQRTGRRLIERKEKPNKIKTYLRNLKQGLPRIAQINNAGGITLTLPLTTECDHQLLKCFYLL